MSPSPKRNGRLFKASRCFYYRFNRGSAQPHIAQVLCSSSGTRLSFNFISVYFALFKAEAGSGSKWACWVTCAHHQGSLFLEIDKINTSKNNVYSFGPGPFTLVDVFSNLRLSFPFGYSNDLNWKYQEMTGMPHVHVRKPWLYYNRKRI